MSDLLEAICIVCKSELFPAPTDNPWVAIRDHKRGICYRCIRNLYRDIKTTFDYIKWIKSEE